jgi:C1A family cysteine protease
MLTFLASALLLFGADVSAQDPAHGWMAYAVGKLPSTAERITKIEMTWTVGANAKSSNAFYSPWFGMDPDDNLNLLQPVNPWMGSSWSMYTEYFQWSPEDNSNSRSHSVEAGQTLQGSIIYDESSDSYTIKQTIVETGASSSQVVKCQNGKKFVVPYVVYEKTWQCGVYPPDGKVTFRDISVECDGKDCTKEVQWQAKVEDTNCNMQAHIDSEHNEISITWDTSATSRYDNFTESELVAKNAHGWAQRFAKSRVEVAPKRHYSRGYKRSQSNEVLPVANLTAEDIANAPDSIDWSAKGATTPVKDQGQCGSCWAFSTTEGVESGVFMATGSLPKPLSTQELVACEKQDGGCDGGDIPEAVKYMEKTGVATDAEYPDTSSRNGKTGKCKKNLLQPAVKVTGMQYAIPPCSTGDCSHQNEEALAAALAKYGPLSICINSGDQQSGDWEKYHGGILKGSCKAKASLTDHCVQLVGYDKSASQPYWKIRNSWGKSYGEEGFIRIPYGNGNECCVGCEAVIISATTEGAATLIV